MNLYHRQLVRNEEFLCCETTSKSHRLRLVQQYNSSEPTLCLFRGVHLFVYTTRLVRCFFQENYFIVWVQGKDRVNNGGRGEDRMGCAERWKTFGFWKRNSLKRASSWNQHGAVASCCVHPKETKKESRTMKRPRLCGTFKTKWCISMK